MADKIYANKIYSEYEIGKRCGRQMKEVQFRLRKGKGIMDAVYVS